MNTETKQQSADKPKRERRRSSTQVGPLSIPTEYLKPELNYRFVNYNPARLDNLYKLGYDPIRLRDRGHEELAKIVGDQTAADGNARDGEFLVITTEAGAKMILCSTPKELFEEGIKEKMAGFKELDARITANTPKEGLMNTSLSSTSGR